MQNCCTKAIHLIPDVLFSNCQPFWSNSFQIPVFYLKHFCLLGSFQNRLWLFTSCGIIKVVYQILKNLTTFPSPGRVNYFPGRTVIPPFPYEYHGGRRDAWMRFQRAEGSWKEMRSLPRDPFPSKSFLLSLSSRVWPSPWVLLLHMFTPINSHCFTLNWEWD